MRDLAKCYLSLNDNLMRTFEVGNASHHHLEISYIFSEINLVREIESYLIILLFLS